MQENIKNILDKLHVFLPKEPDGINCGGTK